MTNKLYITQTQQPDSDSSDTVGAAEEGLAANQQRYYAKKTWKPAVGEFCLYTKKGADAGTVYAVQSVQLVDPTHVPNGLVVECVSFRRCVICTIALNPLEGDECCDCIRINKI